MTENYLKVSLGFAEFVGQLIDETFEAIRHSQQYQVEYFMELKSSLNLSNTEFAQKFLTTEDIRDREIKLFGVELIPNFRPPSNFMTILSQYLSIEEMAKFVTKRALLDGGRLILKEIALETLIDEKKDFLTTLINQTEAARIVVDSGEIKAKIELTTLYQTDTNSLPTPVKKLAIDTKESTTESPSKELLTKEVLDKDGILYKEVIDKETKETTVFIPKSSLINKATADSLSQRMRVTAQPAKVTSTSNLYSEVTIRFKTT